MDINPKTLHRSMRLGFDRMKRFRESRARFMTQFAGRFYARNSIVAEDRKSAPLNLMWNAVTALVPNLVFNDPRVKLRPDLVAYRQYAAMLEAKVNHRVIQVGLKGELRDAITDALFCVGFLKSGLAAGSKVLPQEDGTEMSIPEVYVERCDPDDITMDPLARKFRECAFVGHRVRMSRARALEEGVYPADKIEKLQGRYDNGEARREAAGISQEDSTFSEAADLADMIDLVELYLPDQRLIVTLPWQDGAPLDDFLAVTEYDGPDAEAASTQRRGNRCGPYHMLGFSWMPDNALPVAPAGIWYDLHVMGNRIARKIGRQAERLKRLLLYEGVAVDDAKEIVDADDGETKQVDNIDRIKEVSFGGVDDTAYNYMEWVKRQYSEQTGNLDLLAGVRVNAPTATQSEMLQANTSVRLADMQGLVYDLATNVCQDIAYYEHTDPLAEQPLSVEKGGEMQQMVYTPEARRGEWSDYAISVEPYSMARQDPNMRVKRIMDFATQVVPAGAQAFQILGPAFDLARFFAIVGKETQLTEAEEFINLQGLAMLVMQRQMQMFGPPQPDPAMVGAPPDTGFRPVQPNPAQMGQSTTPDQDRSMQQQAQAAQLQRTY